MISQIHRVYNCSYCFFKTGKQLDFRKSRFPTLFSLQSLQLVFHQLWAPVYTIGLKLKLRMVMLIIMVVVPQENSQVDS